MILVLDSLLWALWGLFAVICAIGAWSGVGKLSATAEPFPPETPKQGSLLYLNALKRPLMLCSEKPSQMSDEKINFEDLVFGALSSRPARIVAHDSFESFGGLGNIRDINTTRARGKFAILPTGENGPIWDILHPLLLHYDPDQ